MLLKSLKGGDVLYPPTHVLMAVLWTTNYPIESGKEKLRLWLACALGSLVSDVPYGLQICLNWAQGITAGSYTEPGLWRATQVAHILLFWLVLYATLPQLFGLNLNPVQFLYARAFTVAGTLHILVDSLTHGKGVGVPYFWPSTDWLLEQIGFWMYKGHNFWPKWPEIAIDLALIAAIVVAERHKARTQAVQATT